MTTRVRSALLVATLVLAGVSIDVCAKARAAGRRLSAEAARPVDLPVARPAGRAATGVRTFADPATGISLAYPAGWRARPARTAELSVAAPAGRASLSLDVPAMPWHPPFIPVGVVTSRYVDAFRQDQVPDATITATVDLKVAGATARRVTARGHAKAGGCVCDDSAVVIVHAGQVYILSCDSDDAGAATARATLDAAVASVKWTK